MPIIECEQQSVEWLAERRGRVTASEVWQIMAKRKRGDGELAGKRNYSNQLVVERLTNLTPGEYINQAMEWVIEQEPFARAAYEMKTDREVSEVGFAVHDAIAGFGASPDGFVDDGCLEIKCLTTERHLQILLTNEIPEEYQWQMLAEMACTGRKWCDFVSFDPRVPHHLQLFIKRFEWDDARIAEMEAAVEVFLGEVDAILDKLGCTVEVTV